MRNTTTTAPKNTYFIWVFDGTSQKKQRFVAEKHAILTIAGTNIQRKLGFVSTLGTDARRKSDYEALMRQIANMGKVDIR